MIDLFLCMTVNDMNSVWQIGVLFLCFWVDMVQCESVSRKRMLAWQIEIISGAKLFFFSRCCNDGKRNVGRSEAAYQIYITLVILIFLLVLFEAGWQSGGQGSTRHICGSLVDDPHDMAIGEGLTLFLYWYIKLCFGYIKDWLLHEAIYLPTSYSRNFLLPICSQNIKALKYVTRGILKKVNI